MGYKIVIGMSFNQPYKDGEIVPSDTVIFDDYCHTIISCVGKTPEDLEFDEPTGNLSDHFWQNLLMQTKGLRKFAAYIEQIKTRVIFLDTPIVKEILEQIKKEIQAKPKSDYKERAKWLVFWAEESTKRYGKDAAIGLF